MVVATTQQKKVKKFKNQRCLSETGRKGKKPEKKMFEVKKKKGPGGDKKGRGRRSNGEGGGKKTKHESNTSGERISRGHSSGNGKKEVGTIKGCRNREKKGVETPDARAQHSSSRRKTIPKQSAPKKKRRKKKGPRTLHQLKMGSRTDRAVHQRRNVGRKRNF